MMTPKRLSLFLLIPLSIALGSIASHRAQGQQTPASAQWIEVLSHMSIVYLDDGQGGQTKTLRISDVNLQIVNGLGATNGYPTDPTSVDPLLTQTNGLGNLIIGYNELRQDLSDERTGSHNLITGQRNNYSSFGGIAAGRLNSSTGAYSSVTGGDNNLASGLSSSIHGGSFNTASGLYSTCNGFTNIASGDHATVMGGRLNTASGDWSSVSGGRDNRATANQASISGGRNNRATGGNSCIGGGRDRTASGVDDWRAGSYSQDD